MKSGVADRRGSSFYEEYDEYEYEDGEIETEAAAVEETEMEYEEEEDEDEGKRKKKKKTKKVKPKKLRQRQLSALTKVDMKRVSRKVKVAVKTVSLSFFMFDSM